MWEDFQQGLQKIYIKNQLQQLVQDVIAKGYQLSWVKYDWPQLIFNIWTHPRDHDTPSQIGMDTAIIWMNSYHKGRHYYTTMPQHLKGTVLSLNESTRLDDTNDNMEAMHHPHPPTQWQWVWQTQLYAMVEDIFYTTVTKDPTPYTLLSHTTIDQILMKSRWEL